MDIIGIKSKVKIVKNKVAPPFKTIEFDIMYGEGVSKAGELIDLGVQSGIVEKSGSWYSYQGDRIGQGKENVREYLLENPEKAAQIEAQLRARLLSNETEDTVEEAEDASSNQD